VTGAITDEQLAKAIAAASACALDPEGKATELSPDRLPQAVAAFMEQNDECKFACLAWAVFINTPRWSVRDRCIVLFEVLDRLNRNFGMDL
jgi:hypothetical protein